MEPVVCFCCSYTFKTKSHEKVLDHAVTYSKTTLCNMGTNFTIINPYISLFEKENINRSIVPNQAKRPSITYLMNDIMILTKLL